MIDGEQAAKMFGQVSIGGISSRPKAKGYPDEWDSFERLDKFKATVQTSVAGRKYYAS
jgi:hypothetical protein